MPLTVCMIGTGQIVWCNDLFNDTVYDMHDSLFEQTLDDIIPGFDNTWLLEHKNVYPSEVKVGDKNYMVIGSMIRPADGSASVLMTLYWIDAT